MCLLLADMGNTGGACLSPVLYPANCLCLCVALLSYLWNYRNISTRSNTGAGAGRSDAAWPRAKTIPTYLPPVMRAGDNSQHYRRHYAADSTLSPCADAARAGGTRCYRFRHACRRFTY